MDHRKQIERLEFYITNVCNLNCSGCNRFNNIRFSGHQRWDDYADVIRRWGEKINVRYPVIMGGEPLLNPTIKQWIQGLSDIWGTVQILSNGTYIDRVPDLYDSLLRPPGKPLRGWIGITLHDPDHEQEVVDRVRRFFGRPVQETSAPHARLDALKSFQDPYTFGHVEIWAQYRFKASALRLGENGRYTLYDNPPERAFNDCSFQAYRNYHFIRGKIYRCGPVALFPELDDQFDLDLSAQDKQLLRSYRPLSIDEYDDRADEFWQHIDDMIPQCKFCNTDNSYYPLQSVSTQKNKDPNYRAK